MGIDGKEKAQGSIPYRGSAEVFTFSVAVPYVSEVAGAGACAADGVQVAGSGRVAAD